MCIGFHVKCPLFMSGFSETRSFSTDCRKIVKISNFMKIRPVAAELPMRREGRTERHEANSLFSQFCERA
jgi:hypothetical protein